ncbi:MAG TPA: hypothetical protein PKC80_06660 [Burkholderiaceae bacterium]|nr:hypothetical protein [Burkholderiaceae bacterium]
MTLNSSQFFSRHLISAMVALAISMVLSTTVSAMSLRELRQLERSNAKQGQWYVQYYLIGVLEGLQEANAATVRKGGAAMFCQNNISLDTTQAKAMFDAERKLNADLYEADMPVQLVMLNALASLHPCK